MGKFLPGHPQYGHRRKGQKNALTIQKEQAREFFEKKHLEQWDKLMKAQLDDSLKDYKAREYSINQIIGKPTENINLKGGVKIELDIL